MNKDFDSLQNLLDEVKKDKETNGANSTIFNRYPIRFILFDNFSDSKEFVTELINLGVTKMQKIVDWMDCEYPDQMLTYSELSERIANYVCDNSKSDCIIVPFSELARYYDNNGVKEFEALISTVKAIQSTVCGFEHAQRIYIPMIGQYGKMSKYFTDSQCIIWHLTSTAQQANYHMILARSTYKVKGLEREFTIVPDVTSWLKVWRDDEVKSSIICTSKSIFAFADNAQPDNAFTYTLCNNAFDFLTKGLHLDFGEVTYRNEDTSNWEKLAEAIEYKNFSFEGFFNKYFDIYDLSDYAVFVKTWFENSNHFKRWLLTTYYTKRFCNQGYICQLLKECHTYNNLDFVSAAALSVFDLENPEEHLKERAAIMDYARKHNIHLSVDIEEKLRRKLESVAMELGYDTVLRYITGLTISEKELLIKWVANGHIPINRLSALFPDLYDYLDNNCAISNGSQLWLMNYLDYYKQSKIANVYKDGVKQLIKEKNTNSLTFYSWYNSFRTVRSELDGRKDIDVYYWIDGLGIDWIPFIVKFIEKYKDEGVFLNEVLIARSLLPSITENNKEELLKLSNNNLSKKGDLDSYAHKCTSYPKYIIDEFEIVKSAIKEIINEHAGKKIAIISDHGLSYLSQLCFGYNIGGIKSEHYGRYAIRTDCVSTQDDKYIILEDGSTICSLRHESLGAKISNGQGCHGGCTPEEVLVPIIIFSAQCQSSEYTINLTDNEIAGSNPILTFRIKGLTNLEIPKLNYNNALYNLNNIGNNKFISDRLELSQDITEVQVHIGDYSQKFKIIINLGAEEEDLFDL